MLLCHNFLIRSHIFPVKIGVNQECSDLNRSSFALPGGAKHEGLYGDEFR